MKATKRGSDQPVPPGGRYLRGCEVRRRYGISRTTLWDWCRKGFFPAPPELGPNAIGWPEEELRAWEASRPRRYQTLGATEEVTGRRSGLN